MSDSAPPIAIRLLVVEDDPGAQELMRRLLEVGGTALDITTAARLDDALALLAERGFDVVLLDLGLPDSLGLQTFRTLHHHAPQVPVVIVSADDQDRTARAALRDGAIDYLPKSGLTADGLIRALRFALDRAASRSRDSAQSQLLRDQQQALLLRLAASGTGGVVGRALGARTLRELSEELFASMVQRFGQIVDLQIDEHVFGTTHDATPRLRDLAADMGDALAGPRDVVDAYDAVLVKAEADEEMTKDRFTQYADACRVAAFELMGYLVSTYRARIVPNREANR